MKAVVRLVLVTHGNFAVGGGRWRGRHVQVEVAVAGRGRGAAAGRRAADAQLVRVPGARAQRQLVTEVARVHQGPRQVSGTLAAAPSVPKS